MSDAIQHQMIEAGDRLINMSIHDDDRDDWDKVFSLEPNTNTMKCELSCMHSPARVLGFSPALYQRDRIHKSDFTVEIIGLRVIRVECNIISGTYVNNELCHVLYEYEIEVAPGYKLTKEPHHIINLPVIKQDHIDNITLRITNEFGELVNFRKEEIIVRLELKKL